MRIFALDPGNMDTGWVIYDAAARRVVECGNTPNQELLRKVQTQWSVSLERGEPVPSLVSEMMRARGMPTSNDEMETLVWIGRFKQAWHRPDEVRLVYRQDAKLHVTGSPKAKDANVRQALIDHVGKPGTRKAPGPTFGVSNHAWAALCVAVYAAEVPPAAPAPARRRARL